MLIISRFKNCFKIPSKIVRTFASQTDDGLLKTPLYDLHLSHGATMVPYAGYSMPMIYAEQSHIESHNWVRQSVGIFDVSHMCQHVFSGKYATKFLEQITPSDLIELEPSSWKLSALMLRTGGILDDTIIAKLGQDKYYIVTNAACKDKDLAFLRSSLESLPGSVDHEVLAGWGLISVQGPKAATSLAKLTDENLSDLKFGRTAFVNFGGNSYFVSRSGYTGEDGFEISLPPAHALSFTEQLLNRVPDTRLIGLAARNSLRLEAGLCLYGNDIDETTTPVDASLRFILGKRRLAEGGFNGFDTVSKHLEATATDQRPHRVGFKLISGPPAREGAKVFAEDGRTEIGRITSGCPSPTLGYNIAMGYVSAINNSDKKKLSPGDNVLIEIRGVKRPAKITKMPFVKPKYYR
ncbi:hypothetical protein V1514DRAFT_344889 [Lipomyces japonicus]|uniref:uncharacterized protein n=1 Tax=Lipomyces japonicus TaxID=56871 RepID=UPI0034CD45F3